MAYIWLIYGLYTVFIWPICGLYMAYIWPIYGLCVVYTWPAHGLHMACPGGTMLPLKGPLSTQGGSKRAPIRPERVRKQISKDANWAQALAHQKTCIFVDFHNENYPQNLKTLFLQKRVFRLLDHYLLEKTTKSAFLTKLSSCLFFL